MKTFETENAAINYMKRHNRASARNAEPVVMVEGPCEGEYTVMLLSEAIENDFLYEWRSGK